jgi:hypothetical protein
MEKSSHTHSTAEKKSNFMGKKVRWGRKKEPNGPIRVYFDSLG